MTIVVKGHYKIAMSECLHNFNVPPWKIYELFPAQQKTGNKETIGLSVIGFSQHRSGVK